MVSKIEIRNLQFFRGAQRGLREKTAIVTLLLDADGTENLVNHACMCSLMDALNPYEGIVTDMGQSGWQHCFLLASDGPVSLAHYIAALSIEFMRWARDPVYKGRIVRNSPRDIVLALPYVREASLKWALQYAERLLLLWLNLGVDDEAFANLSKSFKMGLANLQGGGLSPNSLHFALAARERGIPVAVRLGMVWLGWGINGQWLDSSFTGKTGNLATRIARSKNLTSRMLHEAGIPVPPSALIVNWLNAKKMAAKLGWPVVIKPSNQDQGRGVVPGIRNEELLRRAFEAAIKLSPGGIIVEKHIEGDDHRMLVVGGKLLMCTKRIPGGVTGDGVRTVSELIEQVNRDPRRGINKRSLLIKLALNTEALDCLAEQNLESTDIPQKGRFVPLRRTANISTGGSAVDVSIWVHPENRIVAERAARIVGLDVAGVDFLCPDISRSWREVGGAVCEVNAQPAFRVHWLSDPARDINGEVIDWLFRDKPVRIPTAAIMGTKGASAVARMLQHIWINAGKTAGVSTADGVWIGNDLIGDKNVSSFHGGQILLNDPGIEAAVFEIPYNELIRFGHVCDFYDVAALLDMQEEHIGGEGLYDLQKMEVLKQSRHCIVVNADNPFCLMMHEHADSQRWILISQDVDAPALRNHLRQGGAGVFEQIHNEIPWIVLAEGSVQTLLMPLKDILAPMYGSRRFNEKYALFAAALAWGQEIALDTIRQGLSS